MAVDPSGPRSVDEEFRFKQLKQLRIFDGTITPTTNPTNLLAVSNKFGLVFVGSNKGIRAIKTVDVQKLDDGKFSQANHAAVDYPYKEVSIPYKLSHIALSSDDFTLAACLQIYKSPCAHLYDVRAFADNVDKIEPFVEVRLSAAQNTEVVDYAWNPAVPTLFAVCLSDGSLTVFDITETPSSFKVLGNLPSSIGATSICWSPKGKQIVVGKQNGSMVQFKQDLQATNSVPAPTGLSENPTPVMSICWISNFLFAVSYQCDDRVVLVFVHSKGGQTNFVNYDDMFYATSNERRPYYYMFHQPDWHIVMCASSNASEVAVIGNKADDKEAWVQWILEGTGRAELPMCGNNETFPLGFAIDTTSQYVIPIDETRSIPPMPILYVLSTSGLLCPFYVINVFPNTPGIVKGPEVLSSVGLRRKTVGTKDSSASLTTQNQMASSAKPSASVASSQTHSQVPPKSFGTTIPHFNVGTGDKTLASQPSGGIKTGMPLNSIWKVMQPSASADQSPTSPSLNLTISRSSGTTPFGVQNITKPESVQLTHDKSTKQPVKQPIKEDSTAAIVEEIRKFKSELGVEMKRRSSEVAVQIGTTEELKTLKGGVESLNEFSEEIKKQLLTVQNDVLTLEHSELEAAAILEEMKLCDVRAQDPRLQHLLRQRPLDPIKAKKMRDIVNLFVYLESQIEEVHRTLDQLAEMGKTEKFSLPSMEAVYSVVLNSSLILNGLVEKVRSLGKQTDEVNAWRTTYKSTFNETMEQEKVSGKELGNLTDSLLRTKISVDAANRKPEMNTTLSEEKVTLLRNFFANRTALPKRTRSTDITSRLLSTTPTLMKKYNLWEKPTEEFAEQVTYIREPSPPIAKPSGPMPIMASTPFKFQLNSSFVPVETPEQRSQKSKSTTAGMNKAQPNIFNTVAASKGKPQTDLTVGGAMPDMGERKSTQIAATNTTDNTYICITDIGIPPPTYYFEKSPLSANKVPDCGENVFVVPFEIPSEKADSDDQLSGEDLDKKLYSASDDDSGSGYEDITPPLSPAEFINEVEHVNLADVADSVNTETRVEFGNVKPPSAEKEKITFSFKLPSVASNDKLDAKPAMNLFFNPSNQSGFKLNQGITTSFGQGFSAFGTSTIKPQTVVSTSAATIPTTTIVSTPSAQSPLLSSILSSSKASEPSENTTTQSAPSPIISFSFKQSSSPATTTTATATLLVASVSSPVSSVGQSTTVTTPAFGSAPATVATIVIPQPKAITASSFSFKSPASSPPPAPTTGFTSGHLQQPSTTTQSEVSSPSTGFGPAMTVTSPVSSPSAANFSFSMSTITSPTPFGQIQPAASTATTVSSPAFATQGFTSTVPFKFESSSSTTSTSLFGQSGVFGQKPAATAFPSTGFGSSTGSAFGQAPTFGLTTSAFGQSQPQQSPVTTSTSVFGQQQQQPATSTALGNLFTSGGTGGFFTGLGGKPAADSAVKNVFGAPTTNAPATSTPTNLFGSGTSTGILSAKFGGNFSGGNFTVAGAQSVAQTGFGSFQQTSPKPANVGFGGGAFGASATFGGGPKFGSSPTFGGTPSFGGTPTGTGGLFGSSQTTQQPSFASFAASTTAPTFGSLAAQSPSMSFGTSVPQQQSGTFGAMPQQQQQPPAFGTTGFGSPQPFGGNSSFGSQGSPSFNQWRS